MKPLGYMQIGWEKIRLRMLEPIMKQVILGVAGDITVQTEIRESERLNIPLLHFTVNGEKTYLDKVDGVIKVFSFVGFSKPRTAFIDDSELLVSVGCLPDGREKELI